MTGSIFRYEIGDKWWSLSNISTSVQLERCMGQILRFHCVLRYHLRIRCRTSKRDIMGATWRIQGIKMSSRMSSECRNTRSSPHSSECQDSSAKWNRSCIARILGMINSSLETVLCGFEKFKTQHNMVDFIIPGPKLAEMTLVWVARRRAVIQKVRKIMSDSRSKDVQTVVIVMNATEYVDNTYACPRIRTFFSCTLDALLMFHWR